MKPKKRRLSDFCQNDGAESSQGIKFNEGEKFLLKYRRAEKAAWHIYASRMEVGKMWPFFPQNCW